MENKKIKSILKKWWPIALIIFIIFIIFGTIPDNTNNQKIEEQNNILSTISYEIIEVKDISSIKAKRYSVYVIINNNPTTKQQIEALSEKIVSSYKDIDAISIFYYFDKTQINGAYTLAMAEWAPNGDWGQADLKTNQKLTYQFTSFIDKKRTNEPTALEREINQAMKDKWYELNENSQSLITDEDVAEILAPQYNKTVKEMMEIRERVTFYDLGI
ncbi:MAG: hypothetical protein PHE29_10805 [Tissierellia bacterium]|nr:hypothetical protein [Tissierellia bacterium]